MSKNELIINPSKEFLKGIFGAMSLQKRVAFIDCERGFILRLTGKLELGNDKDRITITKPNKIDRVTFSISSISGINKRYEKVVPLTEFKIKLKNGNEFKIVY